MPRNRPRVAQMHEVIIGREGNQAVVDFRDGSVGTQYITMQARDVNLMTDDEILDTYNDIARTMERLIAETPYVAVEVPPGSTQITYDALDDRWLARADVIRCEIEDTALGTEAVVIIDDQRLDAGEFSRLLAAHAGWGMRIVFVPDYELDIEPIIEVREPETPAEPRPLDDEDEDEDDE